MRALFLSLDVPTQNHPPLVSIAFVPISPNVRSLLPRLFPALVQSRLEFEIPVTIIAV
jgi:hypothetical protein